MLNVTIGNWNRLEICVFFFFYLNNIFSGSNCDSKAGKLREKKSIKREEKLTRGGSWPIGQFLDRV